ncbi:hypothetical protein BDV19DRAFT_392064 [Aspergillus venezuelensis]
MGVRRHSKEEHSENNDAESVSDGGDIDASGIMRPVIQQANTVISSLASSILNNQLLPSPPRTEDLSPSTPDTSHKGLSSVVVSGGSPSFVLPFSPAPFGASARGTLPPQSPGQPKHQAAQSESQPQSEPHSESLANSLESLFKRATQEATQSQSTALTSRISALEVENTELRQRVDRLETLVDTSQVGMLEQSQDIARASRGAQCLQKSDAEVRVVLGGMISFIERFSRVCAGGILGSGCAGESENQEKEERAGDES